MVRLGIALCSHVLHTSNMARATEWDEIDVSSEPSTRIDGSLDLPSARHEHEDVAIVAGPGEDTTNGFRGQVPA